MRRTLILGLFLTFQAVILLTFVYALRSGLFPLGVAGEWQWLRVPRPPEASRVFLAVVGIAIYVAVAGLLMKWLSHRASVRRECVAAALLLPAAVFVQGTAQLGAPDGYGLEKWVVAVSQAGSSGYFTVAKTEVHDRAKFLRNYPRWIQKQDALHLGTHPPGLILVESILLDAMEAHPDVARYVVASAPESVATMLKIFGETNPMSPADRATFVLTGALTLLACSLTVLPLYVLSRRSFPPMYAFAIAAMWPLVSSAILFQPASDTAFPVVSTTILAVSVFAAGDGVKRASWLGLACGLIFGVAMEFTLAFLAVGLAVTLITISEETTSLRLKLIVLFSTLAAFLVVTLVFWHYSEANPFEIWWWNQRNHARFYEEFPRSYRAWVIANPIELTIGLGIPIALWGLVGLAKPRGIPRVTIVTLSILVFLTLGGRNLSEVGRLWLPFMPALIVGAGHGMRNLEAGPKSLVFTLVLLAIQLLALEATIQVVYPI